MAEHREIYMAHYGKDSIKDGNVIHHLDHDPTNNNIINLAQMSMGDHAKLHNTKHVGGKTKPININTPLSYEHQEDNRTDDDDRSKIIWFDI